jgi:hypothetical protein
MAADLTHDEMLALMAQHDLAEGNGDVDAVMKTVCANPEYEFQPLGYHIRSREAVAEMYRRILPSQKDAVKALQRKTQWFAEDGYAVEFELDMTAADGKPYKSHVITAFVFEEGLVKAERVFLGPQHAALIKEVLGADFTALPGVSVLP